MLEVHEWLHCTVLSSGYFYTTTTGGLGGVWVMTLRQHYARTGEAHGSLPACSTCPGCLRFLRPCQGRQVMVAVPPGPRSSSAACNSHTKHVNSRQWISEAPCLLTLRGHISALMHRITSNYCSCNKAHQQSRHRWLANIGRSSDENTWGWFIWRRSVIGSVWTHDSSNFPMYSEIAWVGYIVFGIGVSDQKYDSRRDDLINQKIYSRTSFTSCLGNLSQLFQRSMCVDICHHRSFIGYIRRFWASSHFDNAATFIPREDCNAAIILESVNFSLDYLRSKNLCCAFDKLLSIIPRFQKLQIRMHVQAFGIHTSKITNTQVTHAFFFIPWFQHCYHEKSRHVAPRQLKGHIFPPL